MRTLDEITEDAKPKATFESSKQYEVFVAKQCDSCLIETDTCPLIDAAFLGFWPKEWAPQNKPSARPNQVPMARCHERQPIPKAT